MMKGNQNGRVTGKISLMGSFGENLRREREMRGVTLEEISAATKISVRFLKSIENEEFSRLPGGIFNRSFVRAYARYLGLEEDPLLEEYQLAAKSIGDVDLTMFSPPKTYSHHVRRSTPALWGALIAVVLLVAGFTLWRHSHRPLKAPPPLMEQVPVSKGSPGQLSSQMTSTTRATLSSKTETASKSTQRPARAKAKPGERVPATPGVLAATSAGAPAPPKLPAITDYDGKLVLQIATTERSWMAIDADGKTVMQGIMEPNELKTFRADASFDVLTGNAQGVILTLNGQTFKSLGREGEVKQVHLTWDSLKKQTSH
jgi:cytoskeleton protein RodZ